MNGAVVHLAIPQKDVFTDEQQPPTASVLVQTNPGRTLTPEQVQAVVHLVASSIDGLDRLDGVQRTADQLSVQAATGELQNIHDYTIAATQAAVTTQVTVAVRNKAVEAFTEIMRMQV